MASESVRRFPRGERQLFFDDADVARIDGLQRRMHRPDKKGRGHSHRSVHGRACAAGMAGRPTGRRRAARRCGTRQRGCGSFGRSAPSWTRTRAVPLITKAATACTGINPTWGSWNTKGRAPITTSRFPIDDTRTSEVLGVVYDAGDPDPARRFKAISFTMVPDHAIFFGVSADGIVWKRHDAPDILSGDEPNFSFDAANHRFIATVKVRGPHGRSHALTTSEDFAQWSEPQLVFHADDEDQELARAVIARRLANPALQQTQINQPGRAQRRRLQLQRIALREPLYWLRLDVPPRRAQSDRQKPRRFPPCPAGQQPRYV